MKINGIKPVRTRKHKVTTDSNHRLSVAANWLDGDFAADVPNHKWAGDITYIWTSEGWLYLAVILDLHSRRMVGWAVSDRMKKDLAIRALDMAVACASHLRAACSTPIAAASIAPMTIRRNCRPTACGPR